MGGGSLSTVPDEIAEQVFGHLARMDQESERGCVLIGAAAIDEMLEKLLRAKFRRDARLSRRDIEFLVGDGQMPPLRSLALRIIFCHAFGLITADLRRVLENIKSIRNHFSHFSGEVTIDVASLKGMYFLLPEDARQKIDAIAALPLTDENALYRKHAFSVCIVSVLAYLNGYLNRYETESQRNGS
jgi:hypothetical protein